MLLVMPSPDGGDVAVSERQRHAVLARLVKHAELLVHCVEFVGRLGLCHDGPHVGSSNQQQWDGSSE
jgi:hypothetical protein